MKRKRLKRIVQSESDLEEEDENAITHLMHNGEEWQAKYSQVPHNGPLCGAVLEWKKVQRILVSWTNKKRTFIVVEFKTTSWELFCIGPQIGLQN